jgi:hypothetical protein
MAQEEIIFKVGVDTGDSVQDVNKVGDAIEQVGKDAKKTDGSFVNLRKELKNLTVQLQNLDPASKEFETVAKRAGQIKEQMRGVADAISDADPEKFGGKFQRTAEGIAGAFSAVTGAQALFGQQSEEIEKQMLKVQGAIALTQGISAMKELRNDATELAMSIKNTVVKAFTSLTTAEMVNAEATGTMTLLQKAYALAVGTSTGAMKVFRLALVSTGIGALVVLVGFLIEKIAGFVSNTDAATLAQNKFNASVDRYNKQQERTRKNVEDAIEYQLEYAKAVGMSEEGQYKLQKEGFKKREKLRQETLDNNKIHLEYLKIQRKSALEDENKELVKSINEQITKTREANNNLIGEKYELIKQESLLTANHNRTQKEEQQKANTDASAKRKENNAKVKAETEKEAQERLNLQRKLEDLTVANIDDANTRDIMNLKLKHDREREELVKQYEGKKNLKEKYDALMLELDIQQKNEQKKLEEEQKKAKEEEEKAKQEKENTSKKAQLEAEIIRAEEDFNLKQQKRIELENLDYEQQKANKELTAGELELLKANHEKNLLDIAKDSADRQKMLDEELANSKKFLVDETANMFGSLAGLSKQGSAIQKAFAITELSINTAKSISNVIAGATAAASAGGPAAPFLLGGYIASGIATVTKSLSTAKQILNAPMPSVQPPQQTRPNEQTQTAQQGTTQGIQAQSTYKVVVVDSDITKMQDKTKKVNAISTI